VISNLIKGQMRVVQKNQFQFVEIVHRFMITCTLCQKRQSLFCLKDSGLSFTQRCFRSKY